MLQIQAQFVADTGAVWSLFTTCFVIVARPPPDQIPSAIQSDSVRHPIRFRPPPDQIPSAAQSDSVRRPIRFRPPPVGGYGILPYPRSPHRGCSGLRCTNQAINHQPPINQPNNQTIKQSNNQPTNQPNTQPNHQQTNHLILPIKSSHISNKNTNFANP